MKLDLFWGEAPVTLKWKLRVLDAVIHSKVLYGMESLVISQSDYDKVDAFQNRIFRTILNMKHYWSHVTNATVMNTANNRANNIDRISKSYHFPSNSNKESSNLTDTPSEVTRTQIRFEQFQLMKTVKELVPPNPGGVEDQSSNGMTPQNIS